MEENFATTESNLKAQTLLGIFLFQFFRKTLKKCHN